MVEHHWTQMWLWSSPFHFPTKPCLPFANKKYSAICYCQHGHKSSVLTQKCAVDAMAWSLIFLSCGECHCAPCHGKWNCMSFINETALLAAKQIFDHIVVAIAKAAGWPAFKILSLDHSPWHTCTDISEKLWFRTCVSLVVFISTRDRKFNLYYP